MAPADPFGELPANLSRQAIDDLIRILRRSARDFGVVVARRSRDRLLARIRSVEDGTAIGHHRQDVRPRRATVFLNEDPWVIGFNPCTQQVYRITARGISRPSSVAPCGASNGAARRTGGAMARIERRAGKSGPVARGQGAQVPRAASHGAAATAGRAAGGPRTGCRTRGIRRARRSSCGGRAASGWPDGCRAPCRW